MPRLLILLPVLLGYSAAHAEDITQVLQKDMVFFRDDKMVIGDVRICSRAQGPNAGTEQIMIGSVAPATGVVSRDRFVLIHSNMVAAMTAGRKCSVSPQLIGKADTTITMNFEAAGLQITSTGANGATERFTKLWKDF